jgi:hypothetical protein
VAWAGAGHLPAQPPEDFPLWLRKVLGELAHTCSRESAAAARATNHAACISGELLDRVGGLHLAGDQNGSPLVSCYAASCPACDPSQARIE